MPFQCRQPHKVHHPVGDSRIGCQPGRALVVVGSVGRQQGDLTRPLQLLVVSEQPQLICGEVAVEQLFQLGVLCRQDGSVV